MFKIEFREHNAYSITNLTYTILNSSALVARKQTSLCSKVIFWNYNFIVVESMDWQKEKKLWKRHTFLQSRLVKSSLEEIMKDWTRALAVEMERKSQIQEIFMKKD